MIAVLGLILMGVLAIAGALFLAWHGKPTPDGIGTLASVAVGGLAGVIGPQLLHRPQAESSPEPPQQKETTA